MISSRNSNAMKALCVNAKEYAQLWHLNYDLLENISCDLDNGPVVAISYIFLVSVVQLTFDFCYIFILWMIARTTNVSLHLVLL